MGNKKKPPEPSRNLLRQAIGTAAGYYLWPPVWIDKEPRSTGIKMDLEELSEIGYEQKNPSGISMKVYRDGMFVFDLADWEEGLVSLDTDLPNQEAALRSVQAMTRNRIKLLNTHLACLYTAIARIDGLTQVKMELSPWNL